jgi:hypothetical protein
MELFPLIEQEIETFRLEFYLQVLLLGRRLHVIARLSRIVLTSIQDGPFGVDFVGFRDSNER